MQLISTVLFFLVSSINASDEIVLVSEEISKFAKSNGFLALNIVLIQENSPRSQDLQLLKSLDKQNIQARILDFSDIVFEPFQIVKEKFLFSQVTGEEDWLRTLTLIPHIQVESTIVVSSWNSAKMRSGSVNAQVYLYELPAKSWSELICLNKTIFALVRPLETTGTCSLPSARKPNLNLNKMTITSVDLPWEPHVLMEGCDGPERSCVAGGIAGDYAREVAHLLNISIEFSQEESGSFGVLPLAGGAGSKNSTWTGVLGKVISGQKHMSIAFWVMRTSRHDIADMASVYSSVLDTVLSPRPSELDFGLFMRPFTWETWKAIAIVLALTLLCAILSLLVNHGNYNAQSFRVVSTSAMIFWLLLNAFYGGALTMFFSVDSGSIFGSTEEVIEAYPEWKLIMTDGMDMNYEPRAAESDAYAQFWHRVQNKPQETVVASDQEGLRRVAAEKAVLQLPCEIFLYFASRTDAERDKFKIAFSSSERRHNSFLLADNSPLTSIFHHAFIHLNQFGITKRVQVKWQGPKSTKQKMSNEESMVVTPGQLILIFVVMATAILITLIFFAMEILYHRLKLRSRKKPSPKILLSRHK